MAAPKTTIWDLEPHTRAKHDILRRYLQAWIPILSLGGFPEIIYIDGFAGPGRYSKGEDGSPIIALDAAVYHRAKIQSTIRFLFIELNKDRAAVLQELVDEIDRPKQFPVTIVSGVTFEKAVDDLLAEYTSRGKQLPPTFAFIDPFGWKGVPFSTIQRLVNFPSVEVLITFMYEEINRFLTLPNQSEIFDQYFGTPKWREAISIPDPRERNRSLHDMYLEQLHVSARLRYVRSFQMRNDRDVTDYYLFYGTNNRKGLEKMKEAMWKIDPSGEFTFSDATNPHQPVLFGREPQFEVLQEQLLARFSGEQTTVGDIEEFVVAETAFRETHYKQQVLRRMEFAVPSELEVVDPPETRRRGTYRDPSLKLRFR